MQSHASFKLSSEGTFQLLSNGVPKTKDLSLGHIQDTLRLVLLVSLATHITTATLRSGA